MKIFNGTDQIIRKSWKGQQHTCVEGLPFPEKNPVISTARGVSLLIAIYIGILTPFKLAKANATFAL